MGEWEESMDVGSPYGVCIGGAKSRWSVEGRWTRSELGAGLGQQQGPWEDGQQPGGSINGPRDPTNGGGSTDKDDCGLTAIDEGGRGGGKGQMQLLLAVTESQRHR
ncbi:hypothetical protein U1Q18_019899, partial [Sarracenia purpurea var. burkii]